MCTRSEDVDVRASVLVIESEQDSQRNKQTAVAGTGAGTLGGHRENKQTAVAGTVVGTAFAGTEYKAFKSHPHEYQTKVSLDFRRDIFVEYVSTISGDAPQP